MKKFLLAALLALCLVPARAQELPYAQSFDSSADFATLTLWHADTDSRDWDYTSSAARFYPAGRYSAFDAWFFLPELTFEQGHTYVITFDAKISSSGSSNYKTIRVSAGNDATPDTQTELFSKEIQSTSYTSCKAAFEPETTGTYRIGFRTNASSGSMNDILVDNIKIDAYKELPAAVADATATPGEKGALSVTLTWTNPALNDAGKALSQLSGVKVKRTDSSWVSASSAAEVGDVTEVEIGKESQFVDNTITKSGKYYYYLIPYNANGNCPATPSSIQTAYVGPDTGLSATKNVVATVDPANEKSVSLTWDAPAGTNGGYVDPDGVTWKITRKGGPATVVLEEKWTGTVPYNYVDNTIPELGSYTYTVQYVTADKTETSGATSGKVVCGGAASLPYEETFSSSTALDLYTNFAGETSTTGTTWSKSSYSGNYLQLAQTSGTMDAWLVTPPFELNAGTYYELSFDISASASSTKAIEVMTGNAAAAEALTTSLFDETLSLTSTAATKTVRFKADADGRAYIGFHAKGAASSGYIRLTNIKLAEVIIAPVAATDFTATAHADGSYFVDLAWTNPSTDVLGNPIESLTKVEVLRGSDVVMTYAPAEPGKQMTVTNKVDAPGKYTYSIIAYLGENASEPATATSDKVGGAMELPYLGDFSDEATFAEWTSTTGTSKGLTWTYNSSKGCIEAPDYETGLWLYSPEFKAKKGKVKLILNGASRSSSTSYAEKVEVALYKTTTPGEAAVGDVQKHTFSNTTAANVEFEFDVPEGGVYTIGIARPSYGWNLYLYVADIQQTLAINDNAPLAVTNLTVTADDRDEKAVHLYWTNPSKNVGGADLTEITKIEVYRDDVLVKTLTKTAPGEETGYDDTVETSGVFTYKVIVYVGEDASDPATARSPFIGGGFELPYEETIDSADKIEFWTLPENASGKAWKYEASSSNPFPTSLVASNSDVKAFTAPLKAKKGTVSVTFTCASYNGRYEETIKVGLFTSPSLDAQPVGEWQSKTFASAYPATDTFEYEVPADGTYYVCFYYETSNWYFYLSSVKVEQTQTAVENIIVLWNNTQAKFAAPHITVDEAEPVQMSKYTAGMFPTGKAFAPAVAQENIYYAEIPGSAQEIKFHDGAVAGDISYTYSSPKHMWIYSHEDAKEFDASDVTGIEDIEADSTAKARYFDLSGTEVANPEKGKVYIVLRGSKATKELVK